MDIRYEPYEIRLYKESEYKEFFQYLDKTEFDNDWAFRAQPENYVLTTTLERALEKSAYPLQEAELIEKTVVREFKRLYDGQDHPTVRSDTLYCLSLLRHHGAPTRLLDFTYSKYVALYFGLEYAYDTVDTPRNFAIWCVNTKELVSRVEENYKKYKDFLKAFKSRSNIKTRTDESFGPLYMDNKYKLVISENPVTLHQRLHLQQGVFLCPGNVKETFMNNLLYAYRNQPKVQEIKKIICHLKLRDLQSQFTRLMRMNITHESLFPGLDGLARSMDYQISFYKDLGNRIKRAGGL